MHPEEVSWALVAALIAMIFLQSLVWGASIRVYRFVRKFEKSIKLEGSKVLLPGVLRLRLGQVTFVNLYRGGGAVAHVDVQGKVLSTDSIDLEELCSGGFYGLTAHLARGFGYYVTAPGFEVVEGPFKGIVALCLDPSKVPVKRARVVAKNPRVGKVVVDVSVNGYGYSGKAHWLYDSPRVQRVVFDKKVKVYRVVEELLVKPAAKSVRIEVCGEADVATASGVEKWRKCMAIAEGSEPNKDVTGGVKALGARQLIVVPKTPKLGFKASRLEELFKASDIIGYKKGYVKARVVSETQEREEVLSEIAI